MCLIKENRILPHIAEEDIICWKGLEAGEKEVAGGHVEGYIKTPYAGVEVKKIPYTLHSAFPTIFGAFTKSIKRTGVHAYMDSFYTRGFDLSVKCIIPKGSLYYMSVSGDEIAASKMKIVSVERLSSYAAHYLKNRPGIVIRQSKDL